MKLCLGYLSTKQRNSGKTFTSREFSKWFPQGSSIKKLCKRNSLKGFYKKKYIDRFLSRELFKRNFVRILDAEISILSHKSHRNEPFNAEMMMETHFRWFLTCACIIRLEGNSANYHTTHPVHCKGKKENL